MTMTSLPLLLCTAAVAAVAAASVFAFKHDGENPVERGRYLVTAMGCHDCHTPWHLGANGPEPDMSRKLSGHPAGLALPPAPPASAEWPVRVGATNTSWSGPWGTSFTANLTPDPETGLGQWTADEFVAALRTGRHQGRGRQILPPMPYPFIGTLTDADLHSIFAYLHSLPAIHNKVPEPLAPAVRRQ
jgi:hypothetical protein